LAALIGVSSMMRFTSLRFDCPAKIGRADARGDHQSNSRNILRDHFMKT